MKYELLTYVMKEIKEKTKLIDRSDQKRGKFSLKNNFFMTFLSYVFGL